MFCSHWCKSFVRDNIDYPEDSIEYKRSVIANLITVFAVLVLSLDIYNNLTHGFNTLAVLELFGIVTILINNILFRARRVRLETTSSILVGVISGLAILSLHIDGFEKDSALFWTASLPIYVFAQHGLKRGIRWSILNISGIGAVLLLSAFNIGDPIFPAGLMIQMFIGYVAISFVVYYFEHMRVDYEVRLAKTAREREVMLRELHHRVKNNMQVIMSLLWLQSEKIEEPKYRKYFTENIGRLRAMAMVHENLYSAEDFEDIDMHHYLQMLTLNLQKISAVKIHCECEKSIRLGIRNALSIGLIVNEGVTNAIKYAYDGTEHGEVLIKLVQRGRGSYDLIVRDYGKGLPERSETSEGIGMMLITDLVKGLDNGTCDIASDGGVTITITFDAKDGQA
ncbi:sensor histidine kinase [Sulfurimonas sp. HSL-3221]|uniref:sensor histidine kinase n=1 Tax=Sulfurimonadaceae TaxID=2771471 RepID=UPI001E3F01D4|nr:sensor histidine kinase [Sulfurimonas sp. HSL-3221]UFS61876.1 sensor histidine kinase [Sulfurimonas sp. HSL-3221]